MAKGLPEVEAQVDELDQNLNALVGRVRELEMKVENLRITHNELNDRFIEFVTASQNRAIEVDRRLDALEAKLNTHVPG